MIIFLNILLHDLEDFLKNRILFDQTLKMNIAHSYSHFRAQFSPTKHTLPESQSLGVVGL